MLNLISERMIESFMKIFAVVLVLGFIALRVCLGPMALAYDVNVLNTYLDGGLREVSMWEVPVFILGFLAFEFVVPVALIFWFLRSIGIF